MLYPLELVWVVPHVVLALLLQLGHEFGVFELLVYPLLCLGRPVEAIINFIIHVVVPLSIPVIYFVHTDRLVLRCLSALWLALLFPLQERLVCVADLHIEIHTLRLDELHLALHLLHEHLDLVLAFLVLVEVPLGDSVVHLLVVQHLDFLFEDLDLAQGQAILHLEVFLGVVHFMEGNGNEIRVQWVRGWSCAITGAACGYLRYLKPLAALLALFWLVYERMDLEIYFLPAKAVLFSEELDEGRAINRN